MPATAPAETAQARAAAIMRAAATAGVNITARLSRDYNPQTGRHDGRVIGATVTARVEFTPGDAAAYALAESACNEVLALFRQVRGGSQWGTDSASAGGHAGLTGGYCRLNKSGVEIRLARHFAGE